MIGAPFGAAESVGRAEAGRVPMIQAPADVPAASQLVMPAQQILPAQEEYSIKEEPPPPMPPPKRLTPRTFITTDDGQIDFGVVDESMANEAGITPAPIRLQEGTKRYGWIHIKDGHFNEIKRAGYKSEAGFVRDVVSDFDEVWKQPKNRYLLVKYNGNAKLAAVQLEKEQDKDFYNVITAFISEDPYKPFRSGERIWYKGMSKGNTEGTPSGAHHYSVISGISDPLASRYSANSIQVDITDGSGEDPLLRNSVADTGLNNQQTENNPLTQQKIEEARQWLSERLPEGSYRFEPAEGVSLPIEPTEQAAQGYGMTKESLTEELVSGRLNIAGRTQRQTDTATGKLTGLIEVAMGRPDWKSNVSHEFFHNIEDLVHDMGKEDLTKALEQDWKKRGTKYENLNSREYHASRFAKYVDYKTGRAKKPLLVRKVQEAYDGIINMADKTASWAKGHGWTSAQDVYRKADSGQIKRMYEGMASGQKIGQTAIGRETYSVNQQGLSDDEFNELKTNIKHKDAIDFIEKNRNAIEREPERVIERHREAFIKEFGLEGKETATIQTPIENVTVMKKHYFSKIEPHNDKNRKDFIRYIKPTLEKPNEIRVVNGKHHYVKIFKGTGDLNLHVMIVAVKPDGNFYVTNIPIKGYSRWANTLNRGVRLYPDTPFYNARTGNFPASHGNNILTDKQENVNEEEDAESYSVTEGPKKRQTKKAVEARRKAIYDSIKPNDVDSLVKAVPELLKLDLKHYNRAGIGSIVDQEPSLVNENTPVIPEGRLNDLMNGISQIEGLSEDLKTRDSINELRYAINRSSYAKRQQAQKGKPSSTQEENTVSNKELNNKEREYLRRFKQFFKEPELLWSLWPSITRLLSKERWLLYYLATRLSVKRQKALRL